MAGQPLIILGSARDTSNTKFFVDLVFDRIAKETINLLDFDIAHYNYEAKYPETDDFDSLISKFLKHDTIIFATPVYWYSMSGYMKVFFDRFTDFVTVQKDIGRKFKGKSVFLLAVGTDDEMPSGFEIPFKFTCEYLDMEYKGFIYFSSDKAVLKGITSDIERFVQNVQATSCRT